MIVVVLIIIIVFYLVVSGGLKKVMQKIFSKESFTNDLNIVNDTGIRIYRQVLNDNDIESLKKSIMKDTMVNYKNMAETIDGIIKRNFPSYNWEKYRPSLTGSNIHDASMFHRDVISNDYSKTRGIFYTMVIYLQDSDFTYIPYSNGKLEADLDKQETTTVNKGDLVVFDSTMLHRGNFNKNRDNRTCIQIFNVIHKDKLDNLNDIKDTMMSDSFMESVLYADWLRNIFKEVSDSYYIFNPTSNGTDTLMLMTEGGSKRTESEVEKHNLYYLNKNYPVKIHAIESNLEKTYRFY